MVAFHAGLTPRLDLLEGLLTPLDQLPDKDQFLAYLTAENGRAIPVSALAYNLVILTVFMCLYPLDMSCARCCAHNMVHWHVFGG